MKLPADWKSINLPLGVTVGALSAIFGVWAYLNTTYVLAADFRQYQVQMEGRLLQQQKQQLETEILKLEVKQQTYPQKFDAIDRALLERQRIQLKEAKEELRLLQEKRR